MAVVTVHDVGLRAMLEGAQSVIITCHVNPDGDAVAGVLALSSSLRLAGWDVTSVVPSPVPLVYRFLPEWERIHVYPSGDEKNEDEIVRAALSRADAFICLDSSDASRLGRVLLDASAGGRDARVVNIDHHPSNTNFGDLNLVDPSAAATCELLVSVLEKEGLPIDAAIASGLLVGIVADTLSFRTPSTTAATLRAAASLMEWGASLPEINQRIFNTRSLPALRLWGQVLSRARMDHGLVWSDITSEMLEQCGATLEDADMLIDFIAGVPGTAAAFLFSEQGGKVRASMRTSAELNASELALCFGGGGHARAAGCTLEGPMEQVQQKLLGEARRRLRVAGEHGQSRDAGR